MDGPSGTGVAPFDAFIRQRMHNDGADPRSIGGMWQTGHAAAHRLAFFSQTHSLQPVGLTPTVSQSFRCNKNLARLRFTRPCKRFV